MTHSRRVPFTRLTPTTTEREQIYDPAIERVLNSGWFILGPEVIAFEQEFANFLDIRHAVGVGNGTDGLALALMALGVGAGDEVITTPLTATFTALGISQTGAQPVFADVDPVRLCLTPETVSSVATSKTKAVVPVHLYGHFAELDGLTRLAKTHGWRIVEDACQAHGARRDGRFAGCQSDAGVFSFYPTKNLGALGDGGMVVSASDGLAEKVRSLRNGGQRQRYEHAELGINSRLDEMQAAILRGKLSRLEENNRKRRQLAERYIEGLETTPVAMVRPDPGTDSAWHLFVVRSDTRDQLAAHLSNDGIDTLIHYPVPAHQQPAYSVDARCTEAERASREVLSLPLHPSLTEEEQDQVVQSVRTFFGGAR